MTTVEPNDLSRLLDAVSEAGGVDALLARVAPAKGRTRVTVPFRSAAEVTSAYLEGLIDKAEARRFLGLRGDGPARRPRT